MVRGWATVIWVKWEPKNGWAQCPTVSEWEIHCRYTERVFLMAWGLCVECVVSHLTQHRGEADALKNFVTDGSKWGESCLGFASRHVSEGTANCVTVLSVCSLMFHNPVEQPVGFQNWTGYSIFWLGWAYFNPVSYCSTLAVKAMSAAHLFEYPKIGSVFTNFLIYACLRAA